MASVNYQLNWNNYETNLMNKLYRDLTDESSVCDARIITQNNKIIKVHKIVLSLSSPLLGDLISNHDINDDDRMLTILCPNLCYQSCYSAFQFIYRGCLEIPSENYRDEIAELSHVATTLQLNDLMSVLNDPSTVDVNDEIIIQIPDQKKIYPPGVQTHYNENDFLNALNYVNEGQSVTKVSKKLNIPKTVLWRRVKCEAKMGNYSNLHRYKNKSESRYTPESLKKALNELNQGNSLTSISTKYDIPKSTLHRQHSTSIKK